MLFIQVALKEKGIDKLLDESRKETPFPIVDEKEECNDTADKSPQIYIFIYSSNKQ